MVAVGGAVILVTIGLSTLSAMVDAYDSAVRAGAYVLNVALFTIVVRVLTARPRTIALIRVGAIAAATIWQVLQMGGRISSSATRSSHLRSVRERCGALSAVRHIP